MSKFNTTASLLTILFLPILAVSVAQADIITPGNLQGWAAANIQGTGTVAINTTYPNLTNGSLQFTTSGGADKADFRVQSANAGGFGKVSELSHASYQVYRNAASTAAVHLAPVLRFYFYNPTTLKSGILIWEPVYNGVASVATGVWNSYDATNGNFWMRSFSAPSCTYEVYDITLAEWVSGLNNGNPIGTVLGCTPNAVGPDAFIYEINAGVGSGWSGTFDGGVDLITVGFNGVNTIYNFEEDEATPAQPASWGRMKSIYR